MKYDNKLWSVRSVRVCSYTMYGEVEENPTELSDKSFDFWQIQKVTWQKPHDMKPTVD